MNNLTLTKNEQDKFYEDGFIVLGPDRIFSGTEIQAMQSECYELFPQWEEGFQHEKSRKITFNLSGTVKNHNEISIDFEKSIKNKFFGKRATIIAPRFSQLFVDSIENTNLISANKLLLKCDELSLHNSAIACVYPGAIQEPGFFHVDTTGFTNDALGAVRSNNFVLNAFIYLSDVDEKTAPLRVIPGSAKRFLEINQKISKSFRTNDSVCNLGQFNIYEEILPEGLSRPVFITGKAGTITLMSGHLLHSATSNSNSEKCRYTLAINMARRGSPYFFKNYSNYGKDCPNFIQKFKDKNIPHHTYFVNSISSIIKFKKFLRLFVNLKNTLKTIKEKLNKKPSLNKNLRDYSLVTPPWRNDIQRKVMLEKLYYANGLARYDRHSNSENIKHLKSRKVIVAIPNAEVFLTKYYETDYIFFKKLPMTNYFSEESFRRYITRYFSGIVSSFASEDQLREVFSKNAKEYFSNLDLLEKKLILDGVNLTRLEKDSTFSRYTSEEVDNLFLEAGFLKILNIESDLNLVLNYLGGEKISWTVASYSKNAGIVNPH
jgi:hypothetical protein